MSKITYDLLKSKGACEKQVTLFKSHFPNGAPMTVEDAIGVAQDFNWYWASENLLSEEGFKAYKDAKAPLLKAYKDAKAPLWKAYEDAKAPLLKAYEDAEAPLWKAYEDAKAPLWKAYKDAEAPLLKAYKEGCAKAFAEIYIKENT